MRIDFHTHILPGIDDGTPDIGESLKLLKILSESGVDAVVLTPHFYRQNETIAQFLKRREKSFAQLCEAAENVPHLPKLILGAEVYFFPSLSSDADFEKLCIDGTDYILLELPFECFYNQLYSNLMKFMNRCNKKIILAHIERYLSFGNTLNDIMRLLESENFICQMNCSSIAKSGIFKRKQLLKMINDGTISVIGTDTHNLSDRPPMYQKAEQLIRKKCGEKTFSDICRISEKILFGSECSSIN